MVLWCRNALGHGRAAAAGIVRARHLLFGFPATIPLAAAHPEVTKMEPQHSVGQASSQDNAVEATSTPDDLPVKPTDGKSGAQPVNPTDASENAQGNEVRNEDMEPSDASESNPDPAGSQRSS